MRRVFFFCGILFLFGIKFGNAQTTNLDVYAGIQYDRFNEKGFRDGDAYLIQKIKLTPLFGTTLVQDIGKKNIWKVGLGARYHRRSKSMSSDLSVSNIASNRYSATYKSHQVMLVTMIAVELKPKKKIRPYFNLGPFLLANIDRDYNGKRSWRWVDYSNGEVYHGCSLRLGSRYVLSTGSMDK